MNVKLLRLATVFLSRTNTSEPIRFPAYSIPSLNLSVEVLDSYIAANDFRHERFLVGATTHFIEGPWLDEEEHIVVPKELRERTEEAIEHAANLASVLVHRARQVSSPSPCIALQAESQMDLDILARATGIHANAPALVIARSDVPDEVLSSLTDRLDGVALLAEAVSSTNAVGKLHDLVRVFERAFKLGGLRLATPLHEFLSTGPGFGYTELEVRDFIKETRDAATHADIHETFALDLDVQRVIWRAEQAAYDVLLNKEVWRSSSTSRREVWNPTGGSSAPNVPFIVRGTDFYIEHQLFDEFGAFPLDLSNSANQIPEGWTAWLPPGPLSSGPFDVR